MVQNAFLFHLIVRDVFWIFRSYTMFQLSVIFVAICITGKINLFLQSIMFFEIPV